MNRFKLATSLFVTASLLSTVSFASAIMKDEAPPIATASVYNWSGYYAGLNAGLVNHTLNMTDNQAVTFRGTITQVSDPQFTGGFQVGYRRQLDLTKTSGVYGAEFSGNFANASYSQQYGSPFAIYQLNSNNEVNNLWLLQLIGGIAADKTLLFLAAGLSYTNISGTTTNVDSIPFFTSFSVDKKALGTAFGAGIEYALTDKISARVKLDYITPTTYTTTDNTGNQYQISNSLLQGTFGVNYKFA